MRSSHWPRVGDCAGLVPASDSQNASLAQITPDDAWLSFLIGPAGRNRLRAARLSLRFCNSRLAGAWE